MVETRTLKSSAGLHFEVQRQYKDSVQVVQRNRLAGSVTPP